MTVAARSADDPRLARDASTTDRDRLVITIDGPAGTGKSTVARKVAVRLGLFVLDTGAMYRAVSWATDLAGLDPSSEPEVLALLEEKPIDIDTQVDPPRVLIGGADPGEALRGPAVESIVSTIAALPEVRRRLVEIQRAIALRYPRLVTEGRDQGSVVFPDATARFYLTASASIRAARRVDQLRNEGRAVDPEKVLDGIESRDRLDASRKDSPLVRPAGAVVLDTDELTLEAVVDQVVRTVESLVPSDEKQEPGGSDRC